MTRDIVSLSFSLADAIGNNVILNVVRRGLLGDVIVYWYAGLPGSLVKNGSIVPSGDNFRMNSDNATIEFSLLVGEQHYAACEIVALQQLV